MASVPWSCPICAVHCKVPETTPRIRCRCGYVQLGITPGLGDHVAATLHKIGITPERYANAKAAVGLKRKCRCHKRQRQLNELGRKIAALNPFAAHLTLPALGEGHQAGTDSERQPQPAGKDAGD